MKCTPMAFGDSGVAFVCSRGRRDRRLCSVPGCGRRVARECDAPVSRKGIPGTCDRPLCASCAVKIGIGLDGDSVDFCPPHASTWREKTEVTVRDVAPVIRSLIAIVGIPFLETSELARKVILERRRFGGRIVEPATEFMVATMPYASGPCLGARNPMTIGAKCAQLVQLAIGDTTLDSKTAIVVQSQPIAVAFEGDPDSDRWSFFLRIGVGRAPAESE